MSELRKYPRLLEEAGVLSEAGNDAEKQERAAIIASSGYKDARDEYEAESIKYSAMRSRFLDGQAGILARGLVAGKPLPCLRFHGASFAVPYLRQ